MKNKKSNQSYHHILEAGEEVVWQGKPHTTLLESLRLQLFEVNDHIDGLPDRTVLECLWHLMGFHELKKVLSKRPMTILLVPVFIVNFIITLAIFTRIMHPFNDVYVNPNASNKDLIDLLAGCVFFSLYVSIPALCIKIVMLCKRGYQGVIEKRSGLYLVTDRRIIVYGHHWMYDFVFNNAVQHAVVRDTKFGQSISWYTLGSQYPVITQFIGLSEFDVNHVLHTIDKQRNTAFNVIDKRRKIRLA